MDQLGSVRSQCAERTRMRRFSMQARSRDASNFHLTPISQNSMSQDVLTQALYLKVISVILFSGKVGIVLSISKILSLNFEPTVT